MSKGILLRVLIWAGITVILVAIVIGAAILVVKNQGATAGNVTALTPTVSSADHFLGNPSATTTLVEYADFQCPACQAYYPLLKQLTTDYKDKIKFVYRYFPLTQHPNALPTAKAAEAAGDQGKFWEMHDLLFANYKDWENLSDPTPVLMGYANQLSLDTTKFQADMNSTTTAKIIADDATSATTENLPGTPSFFLNGTFIAKNPQNYQDLKIF